MTTLNPSKMKNILALSQLFKDGQPLGRGQGTKLWDLKKWRRTSDVRWTTWAALEEDGSMFFSEGGKDVKVSMKELEIIVGLEGRADEKYDALRRRYIQREVVGGRIDIRPADKPNGGVLPDGSKTVKGLGPEGEFKELSLYGFYRSIIAAVRMIQVNPTFDRPKLCLPAEPTEIGARWLNVDGEWVAVKPTDWPVSLRDESVLGLSAENQLDYTAQAVKAGYNVDEVYIGFPCAQQGKDTPWEPILQKIPTTSTDVWEALDADQFVAESYDDFPTLGKPVTRLGADTEALPLDSWETAEVKGGAR